MNSYAPARRRRQEPELEAQTNLFTFLRSQAFAYPDLLRPFSVPNGFYATPHEKQKMLESGLHPGVHDIQCPPTPAILATGCAGLWVEMKNRGRKPTPAQEAFRAKHEAVYRWAICFSWIEAARAIVDFYGIKDANIDCALGDRKR